MLDPDRSRILDKFPSQVIASPVSYFGAILYTHKIKSHFMQTETSWTKIFQPIFRMGMSGDKIILLYHNKNYFNDSTEKILHKQ